MVLNVPRLPLDQPSFRNLREEGYIYVDKTQHMYNLIRGGRCFFLSRPRRFGKSLLVSTLQEILAGNRELFNDLWIGASDYQWQPHGIINLDLSALNIYRAEALPHCLSERLAEIAASYKLDIHLERINPGLDLRRLVLALHERFGRVAILVDEYDSPILSYLHDQTQAKAIRDDLQRFFSVIKGLGSYVRFLFITGVSAFSQAGIFSGMNDLQVITMQDEFADICGYTEVELNIFKDHITAWADRDGVAYSEQLDKLRSWYNGYRFSKRELRVYSSFSFMKALKAQSFENFWFATATPTFLIGELKKQEREHPGTFEHILENKSISLTQGLLNVSDIGETPLPALMFQTGYLTVIDYDKTTNSYQLGYPNREVEQSLQLHLLSVVAKRDSNATESLAIELSKALVKKDIATIMQVIREIFEPIPYYIHGKSEKYYHSVLYMTLKVAGLAAQAELATSHGRADIVINLPNVVYVIEVKFKESAAKALEQIEKRKYYEQFLRSRKTIILLGISFKRGDSEFEIEYEHKMLCA